MSEPNSRILIIEDDVEIRRFVRLALKSEGYEVFETGYIERGLIEAGTRRPDLVILDLGLPDGDGVDFIYDLRGWSTAPIIVLSARIGEKDKIGALDAGADDYLVKPFGSGELLARVRAQLRRNAQQASTGDSEVLFGNVHVNLVQRLVTRDGQTVHLTPIEYRLLTLLITQPSRILTHHQLLMKVWGPSHLGDNHYVRVHIASLRKKIEQDPSMPKYLITETGVDYRFAPDENI